MEEYSVKDIIKIKDLQAKRDQVRRFFLMIKHEFKKEELLLKKHAVPDINYHTKLHDELIRTMISFEDQLDTVSEFEIDKMILFVHLTFNQHEDICGEFTKSFIRIKEYMLEVENAQ